MNINIRTKLTAGFVAFVVLMTILAFYSVKVSQKSLQESVGKSSVFLADEMLRRIDRDIYTLLEKIQIYAHSLLVQETVSESNQEFEKLDDIKNYIDQRDGEWVSSPEDEVTTFMSELIANKLSHNLRKEFIDFYEKEYGYRVFLEAFVTNKFGANVSQTGKTSDYRQDDEEWWQAAREEGFYVSNVQYDESANAHVISIGVRIEDEKGDFMGAIKGVVSSYEIMKVAVLSTKKYQTTEIKLITEGGGLIYATDASKFLEDVSKKSFFNKITAESGFFTAQEGGKEKLFSYTHSRGYRDFKGLSWILVVGYNTAEVLGPAFRLRNNIAIASGVLIIIGIIASFFISRSISNPLRNLTESVRIIGKGDLDHKVKVKSKDEIGELGAAFNRMTENLQQITASRDELNKEITERKKVEQKLKKTMADLARSNKELEQFAYVASHDLQEPLRMISSYTQLLEKRYSDKLDQDAREFINYAVDGANRMQKMINDLLQYSRVTTRGKEFELVEVSSALGQARANLNILIEENQAMVTNDELPQVKVDKSQLVLLFQNLIHNAIKFRGEETPHVHISAEEKENEWVFSVADNGRGIEPEYRDKIFTIFKYLHGKKEYTGTGIGLALCKRIVNRHGGEIWVESEPGEGSTFYFTLSKRGG